MSIWPELTATNFAALVNSHNALLAEFQAHMDMANHRNHMHSPAADAISNAIDAGYINVECENCGTEAQPEVELLRRLLAAYRPAWWYMMGKEGYECNFCGGMVRERRDFNKADAHRPDCVYIQAQSACRD